MISDEIRGRELSVDSKDKNERINARRLRIENRRETIKIETLNMMLKTETDSIEDVDVMLKHIKNSQKLLQKVKLEGFEVISNIRTELNSREIERRLGEEKAQKLREEKLGNDREVTLDKFEEISKKWQNATTEDNSYKLRDILDKQRSSCEELMQAKDQLLDELKNILQQKDQEYVEELKRQYDDVTRLSVQMKNQVNVLKQSMKEQLEHIESVYMDEMGKMMAEMNEKWNKLLKDRMMKEADYMENRDIQSEIYEKRLNEQRLEDSEEYSRMNIKLEKNIQELQQQIQEMQVTYQMNQEKLEYNFQVLRKRDEENFKMKSVQKKKIKRLNDHLSVAKKKTATHENSLIQNNADIVEDYKFLIKRFRVMLEKARITLKSNNQKYEAVWMMNEEECRRMAARIMDINMVLYQQQLCLPWTLPELPFMNDKRPFCERILDFQGNLARASNESLREKLRGSVDTSKSKILSSWLENDVLRSKLKSHGTNRTTFKEVGDSRITSGKIVSLKTAKMTGMESRENISCTRSSIKKDLKESVKDYTETRKPFAGKRIEFEEDYFYEENFEVDECLDVTPPALVRHIFKLICDETGFMLEDKVWSLLNSLNQHDQTLMKLDSVFSMMGIESEKDIKALSKYFLKTGTKSNELKVEKELTMRPNSMQNSKQHASFASPFPKSEQNEKEEEEEEEEEGEEEEEEEEEEDDDDEDKEWQKEKEKGGGKRGKREKESKERRMALEEILIKPNDILMALKAFVDANNTKSLGENTCLKYMSQNSQETLQPGRKMQDMISVIPKPVIQDVLMKHNLYDLYMTTKLIGNPRDTTDDQKYWEQYSSVNKPYQDVWNALEMNFDKYYKVLMDRAKLIEKKEELIKQNAEYHKLIDCCTQDSDKLPDIKQ